MLGTYLNARAVFKSRLISASNVFVHDGVLPMHLDYGLERINEEVSNWLLGQGEPPAFIPKRESPTWTRNCSDEVGPNDGDQLAEVLTRLGAARIIVGHTVQEDGIGSFCDDRVWCIDAGMSEYYGSRIEVLEIDGDQISVLR